MSYLPIYLNDHLAGATVGVQLARRSAQTNRDRPSGPALQALAGEIAADRVTLVDVMGRLGVRSDRLKTTAAVVGERLGRLKLNGELRDYSPLSLVVETEGLSLGVEGKLMLWTALQEAVGDDARLAGIDFEALGDRARDQRDRLKSLREDAVSGALVRAA